MRGCIVFSLSGQREKELYYRQIFGPGSIMLLFGYLAEYGNETK